MEWRCRACCNESTAFSQSGVALLLQRTFQSPHMRNTRAMSSCNPPVAFLPQRLPLPFCGAGLCPSAFCTC